jgi:hypothetical protein
MKRLLSWTDLGLDSTWPTVAEFAAIGTERGSKRAQQSCSSGCSSSSVTQVHQSTVCHRPPTHEHERCGLIVLEGDAEFSRLADIRDTHLAVRQGELLGRIHPHYVIISRHLGEGNLSEVSERGLKGILDDDLG